VEGVDTYGGRVRAVRLGNGMTIATDAFVIAAGPFLKQVGQMVGVDFPVFSELHIKVGFRDDAHAFPRNAPLLIWIDAQNLPWSDEERALFAESDETRTLLREFPAGVHARPEGGAASPTFLVLWTFHTEPVEPILPIRFDPRYPEIALRGLSSMLPSLRTYFDSLPRLTMDGGYYTKTQENRPLIGPLPMRGAFVIAALSGYGVMAACAAGELLAGHVTGAKLPAYAPAFALERYQDPAYQALLKNWGASGQL
jgi:glycine/D-amino acid oxidase-like deaminating enzyme